MGRLGAIPPTPIPKPSKTFPPNKKSNYYYFFFGHENFFFLIKFGDIISKKIFKYLYSINMETYVIKIVSSFNNQYQNVPSIINIKVSLQ